MVKIICIRILGLIGSLPIVCNIKASQIHIDFDNQGSFYTSPVVYLTGIDGQNPQVAMKNGIPTTAGVNEKQSDFTKFTSVTFQNNTEIKSNQLKIIPFSIEENTFCNQITLSLENNKIILPETFPKLTTSTSCHFKIVTLNNTQNNVTENKITFIFNYTLLGWLSDLGNGTNAKKTAEIIINRKIDPNSKKIELAHQNLEDISPLMGFIHAEDLDLTVNQIKVIPDAIRNLTHLKYIDFIKNKIKIIPDAISNSSNLQELELNYNEIEIIPNALGNLTNLMVLCLSYNQIEVIPNSLGNLTNLRSLYLSNNQIKLMPNAISGLYFLHELDLSNNEIEVIPNEIGNLIHLQYLDFIKNKIKIIPDAIGNLTQLKYLLLAYNEIEVIPDTIGYLTNLYYAAFIKNKIKVIPDALKNLIFLYKPWFDYNEINYINKSLYDWLLMRKSNFFNNPGADHNFGIEVEKLD